MYDFFFYNDIFLILKIFFLLILDMYIYVYVFDYKYIYCDFFVVWCYV